MVATPKRKSRSSAAKKRSTPTPTSTLGHRRLIKVLRQRGWVVKSASDSRKLLPAAVAKRYQSIPAGVEEFLSSLQVCVSPHESAWFLTADDYARKRGSGFRWNEIELMMIEGAEGDRALAAEYRSFWDDHFPVMLAVHSDYDYLAVRISDGAVVHGYAPEWESSKVARSFAALLSALATEADTQCDRRPWSLFVGKGC